MQSFIDSRVQTGALLPSATNQPSTENRYMIFFDYKLYSLTDYSITVPLPDLFLQLVLIFRPIPNLRQHINLSHQPSALWEEYMAVSNL